MEAWKGGGGGGGGTGPLEHGWSHWVAGLVEITAKCLRRQRGPVSVPADAGGIGRVGLRWLLASSVPLARAPARPVCHPPCCGVE